MNGQSGTRTVHGITPGGTELVRYSKTGRWYLERPNLSPAWTGKTTPYIWRKLIDIPLAAVYAAQGQHFPGLAGGAKFDEAVREATERIGAMS